MISTTATNIIALIVPVHRVTAKAVRQCLDSQVLEGEVASTRQLRRWTYAGHDRRKVGLTQDTTAATLDLRQLRHWTHNTQWLDTQHTVVGNTTDSDWTHDGQ
jgi:hypothetical protein